MHTQDMAEANIEKIGQLFPNCLTERINENGKPEMAIDFDKLKQELSKEVIEGNQERYQFTWPGKREAMRLANTPTNMSLRPCREDSVDFDNTENLYIEGDNLEVLKLLRENYLGKVKMIYIDPPYNTGNDFVYEDDFSQTSGEFKDKSGMFDENGNMVLDKYSVNSESNGRFHTDWLNMMYPRLKVAKDLLSSDGVIYISIDDNEIENLRKICDEIFGEQNFVAQFIWKSRQNKDNRNITGVSIDHEYILAYSKTPGLRALKGTERKTEQYTNPDNDPRGPWTSANMAGLLSADLRPNCHYDLINPKTGINYGRPQMGWRYDKNTMQRLIEEDRIIWPNDPSGRPRKKSFLSEITDVLPGYSSIVGVDVYTRTATKEVEDTLGGRFFDFPKPISLIESFIEQSTDNDSIVLDFFSGSSTTAHAVMKINLSTPDSHRKFIMVQIPEKLSEKGEAFKKGYLTICDIAEDRIRKAGLELTNVHSNQKDSDGLFGGMSEVIKLDTGFRVLKLDTSNMQDVYYTPEESNETTLFEDNVKPDRTPEDLLFQVMLECNIPLSAKIKTQKIAGKDVFSVNDGYLIACFDDDVNETVITEVAKNQPYYFIMRDKSLSSDNVADNFEQIFNAYSKDTIRRIL